MADPEIRSVPFELRATGDGRTLEGYAAVFNSPARIYERGREFDEVIVPGAFARAVNSGDRIIMQFDHGQHPFFGSLPIARIDQMREDSHGLYVKAEINDNWMTEPIRSAIANGAVTGMSFRFSVPDGGDTWDRSGDVHKRTIKNVYLYELGPVTTPAYADTSVGVRSALGLLDDEQKADLLGKGGPIKGGVSYHVGGDRGPEIFVPWKDARQISDPEEDATAQALITQMKDLAAQLAEIEAGALVAGDDTVEDLSQVISLLYSLDCMSSEEADDTEMVSAGPRPTSSRTRRAARARLVGAI